MSSGYRPSTISSIIPLASNEHGVELNYIRSNTDNSSIKSNTSLSSVISNSINNFYRKIRKKLDYLNVEERGIDRVLSQDRTDLTILNTAMIWVTYLTLVENENEGEGNDVRAISTSIRYHDIFTFGESMENPLRGI
jgi:hypothetical protein